VEDDAPLTAEEAEKAHLLGPEAKPREDDGAHYLG
jgi:hypothetical protein